MKHEDPKTGAKKWENINEKTVLIKIQKTSVISQFFVMWSQIGLIINIPYKFFEFVEKLYQ